MTAEGIQEWLAEKYPCYQYTNRQIWDFLRHMAYHPFQILLVTTEHQYTTLRKFSKAMNASNLKVLKIPVANKRLQVCKAILFVKTRITAVMADDDVTWPSTILPWLTFP